MFKKTDMHKVYPRKFQTIKEKKKSVWTPLMNDMLKNKINKIPCTKPFAEWS